MRLPQAMEVSSPDVPCTLRFETPEIRDWARRAAGGLEIQPRDLLGVVQWGFAESRGYEPLLLAAYLFAALDWWRLAELYAELAVSSRRNADEATSGGPTEHEGLFFWAVCIRMRSDADADHYATALALVREARTLQKRAATPHEDARYLKEEGTIVLRWNALVRLRDSTFDGASPPPTSVAVNLLEKALEAARNDKPLQAQVHNNLCYFFLSTDLARARVHLARLVELQSQWSPNIDDWPANLVDTYVYAEWILNRDRTSDERRRELAGLLQRAASRKGAHDPEKVAIQRHLAELTIGDAPALP